MEVVPLAVVANKLQRIEAELRLLNMKLSGFANERCSEGSVKLVQAQVEQINEVLESIKRLVSNLEFDEPTPSSVNRVSRDDEYSLTGRKPQPELDD